MIRNFGTGILIVCFGFSNINLGWAAGSVEVAPVVIQPYEIQELNQQMMDRDRQNRDEEIAIKGLIEENDKLTQTTLAHQEDEGLAKINQTMLSYRDALLSRDRTRIMANGERWWTSRYGDLIALTEDADAMTIHQDLVNKSDFLAEKYLMLTQLKDEMTALNEKLKGQQDQTSAQNQAVINGFKKMAQDEQDKVQMLVDKLGETDKKIAQLDEIIDEKDRQIAELKENLSAAQNEATTKDGVIKEKADQVELLKNEATTKDGVIKEKTDQVDLLKEELEDKITELNGQGKKDEIIKEQENQIAILQQEAKALSAKEDQVKTQVVQVQGLTEQAKDQSAAFDKIQSKLDAFKSQIQEQADDIEAKDKIIRDQASQIQSLSQQPKVEPIKAATVQTEILPEQPNVEPVKIQTSQPVILSSPEKIQSPNFDNIQAEVAALKNQLHQQDLDLKAKNESIRWLNEVLAVAKNKAEYFKLTSQQDNMTLKQIQDEVQKIKDDFALRFKDFNQFESTIASLKDQAGQLDAQLVKKQQQVDLLKEELENKITELKNQSQKEAKMRQDLEGQLQESQVQIGQLKDKIQSIQQGHAQDDRLKLAQQLIDLQQQEAALLDERSKLALEQYDIFEHHFDLFDSRMKNLVANRNLRDSDLQDRMEEMQNELSQKEQQAQMLNAQLRHKITEEMNQGLLKEQIQDLKTQLQGEEDQIASMKKAGQEGQKSEEETDSLKQQLQAQQDKADQLKQQLDSKTAESNKLTLMLADYQKKLESGDNANNEQLRQVLSLKNNQARMEKQITYLNLRLREKEAELIKVKKDMYDLREMTSTQDRDAQAKDLSLSMVQQKMMDEKTKEYQDKISALQVMGNTQAQAITNLKIELALAHQQLSGMPSSDEIDFLKTGLEKATAQLKQKNELFSQIKADADEYAKEFKEQSREFHSLKEQLQDALQDLDRKDEDLKYKDLALVRLKERSTVKEGDLQDQVNVLTRKLDAAMKELMAKTHVNKVQALQAQLKSADSKIKELQAQLNQLKPSTQSGPGSEKLKQAVDKIDEQGRVISLLTQKLEDCGQTVNISKIAN